MHILTSGDRSYIGAVLVPHRTAQGHEVVGLDAGWYDCCDFGSPFTDYEQRKADVRDSTVAELEVRARSFIGQPSGNSPIDEDGAIFC